MANKTVLKTYDVVNADKTLSTAAAVQVRLTDNGDGTYSEGLGGSGGGGGGAVTVADGADVTQGAKADAFATDSTSAWSVVALLKGLYALLKTFVYPASTSVSSTAYEKSHVLKASAGRLFCMTGYNSGGAQFYQLHDAAALPADTAVPVLIFYVPAGSNFALDFGLRGRSFANGVVVCNSSTGPTKTIGATADSWFDAQVA